MGKEGLPALQKRCEELAVQPRGTRGESGGFDGCTYDISNKHRLGYSEVQLIQVMIDGVNTLWKEDLELQKKHGLQIQHNSHSLPDSLGLFYVLDTLVIYYVPTTQEVLLKNGYSRNIIITLVTSFIRWRTRQSIQ